MLNHAVVAASALLVFATAQMNDARADTLRTGGTGAASMMLHRLGAAFTAQEPGTLIEVVPGLGSAGAISAVGDGALDFAVAGRPLKPDEVKNSLTAIVFARTVFGLASSYGDPGNIASSDIARFFTDPTSSWPDGTPLRIILRPRSDADSALLGDAYPNMVGAIEQLRQRPEISVAATDQDNVRIAERMPGSLVLTTLTQMQLEKPNLHFIAIDGVLPALDNYERGAYPYHKDFYLILPGRKTAAVDRFLAFLHSSGGEKVLRETGNLAVHP